MTEIELRKASKLARQRVRRQQVRRIDYSPSPLVAQQLERFKAARPTEPLQGVIDLLVMRAAMTIPEGWEDRLWA